MAVPLLALPAAWSEVVLDMTEGEHRRVWPAPVSDRNAEPFDIELVRIDGPPEAVVNNQP